MAWILNGVYLLALLFSIPWQLYRAIFQGKSRRGWGQKLFGIAPPNIDGKPLVWIHAVSVGEVILADTFAKKFRLTLPDYQIAISTSTESGYDLAVQRFEKNVFFFPFDFTWAMNNAFKRLRPNLLLLMELEVWPNMVRAATNNQTPIVVVNGRLSESSFNGYQRFRWLLRPVFAGLTKVLCQGEEYAERFRKLGAGDVEVSGNIKFDGTETNRENDVTTELGLLTPWRDIPLSDSFVWVAGSTQPEEDQIIVSVFSRLLQEFPQLKLVIAPRHLQNISKIASLLSEAKISFQLRSKIPATVIDSAKREQHSVLVVDVIGELKYWWGVGHAAYVGGSMGKRGGQNMIEPAGFGVPLAFGPNTKNFKDVVKQLLASQAAVVVRDECALESFLKKCMSDRDWAAKIGENAKRVVLQNQGALSQTMSTVQTMLLKN